MIQVRHTYSVYVIWFAQLYVHVVVENKTLYTKLKYCYEDTRVYTRYIVHELLLIHTNVYIKNATVIVMSRGFFEPLGPALTR